MNFSVSSHGPTEKKCVFCAFMHLFLCGLTHRKISFNLGGHNFFCAYETHKKIVSDGEHTEQLIFSVIIFLWVFF